MIKNKEYESRIQWKNNLKMIREKITDLEDRQKRTEHTQVDVSEEVNRKK